MSELDEHSILSQQIPSRIPFISEPLIPDLPQEIIADILSRLSVKTLIRYKCVSSSFLFLISSTHFINTHLVKSSNSNNHTYRSLIVSDHPSASQSGNCISSLHSIPYSTLSEKTDINSSYREYATELDYPLRKYGCRPLIVGSYNGLVCVYIGKNSIFLWNPCTRESKDLMDLSTSLRLYNSVILSGFGYDHLNDDYKVVWIIPWIDNWMKNEKRAAVYSLRTNSWRQIGNCPHAIYLQSYPYHDTGKFVNGVLHWKVKAGGSESTIIVSFDLGNETYGEIAQPNYGDGHTNLILSVLEGLLCISCNFKSVRVDIWVMKEYGIRDSWIKLCTVPYTLGAYPLCITMSREILLKSYMSFILFDPIRNPENLNLFRCNNGEVTTYVESLVSPSSNEEREKQVAEYIKRLEREKRVAEYIKRLERENAELVVKKLKSDSEKVKAERELESVRKRNEVYEWRITRLEEDCKRLKRENKLLFTRSEEVISRTTIG